MTSRGGHTLHSEAHESDLHDVAVVAAELQPCQHSEGAQIQVRRRLGGHAVSVKSWTVVEDQIPAGATPRMIRMCNIRPRPFMQ